MVDEKNKSKLERINNFCSILHFLAIIFAAYKIVKYIGSSEYISFIMILSILSYPLLFMAGVFLGRKFFIWLLLSPSDEKEDEG